jgi:hypothetical protein
LGSIRSRNSATIDGNAISTNLSQSVASDGIGGSFDDDVGDSGIVCMTPLDTNRLSTLKHQIVHILTNEQ